MEQYYEHRLTGVKLFYKFYQENQFKKKMSKVATIEDIRLLQKIAPCVSGEHRAGHMQCQCYLLMHTFTMIVAHFFHILNLFRHLSYPYNVLDKLFYSKVSLYLSQNGIFSKKKFCEIHKTLKPISRLSVTGLRLSSFIQPYERDYVVRLKV